MNAKEARQLAEELNRTNNTILHSTIDAILEKEVNKGRFNVTLSYGTINECITATKYLREQGYSVSNYTQIRGSQLDPITYEIDVSW